MFYCEACQKEKNWPEGISRSLGKCEMCDKRAVCYDVPSRFLPAPPKQIKQRWSSYDVGLLASQIAELVKEYDLETDFDWTDLSVDFVFSLLQHNDREHYDTDVMGN
jgi:hypothetical protein